MQGLTIGDLFERLKYLPRDTPCYIEDEDGKHGVRYPHSYRGYYEQVALDIDESTTAIKASELYRMLEPLPGNYLTGWKGGEFLISDETPVWISRPGEVSDRRLVGLMLNREGCKLVWEEEE